MNVPPALSEVKVIALDLDGVVYLGERALPGAVEAIKRLRALGFKVWFVTNNSAKTRAEIAAKLVRLGVPVVESEVLGSAYATGFLIRHLSGSKRPSAITVGSDGLRAEIAHFGVQIVDRVPCDFLVVGFDRDFTYEKICLALDALAAGATFVACNRDARFPVGDKHYLPGCGAMVAAIEEAYGAKCAYEVGKPNTLFLQMIAETDGVAPYEILVVGDSIESDIVMARRFGSPCVLVSESAESETSAETRPTVILSALEELPPLFAAGEHPHRTPPTP